MKARRRSVVLAMALLAGQALSRESTLAERIQAVIDRPQYRHAFFGVEVYSITDKKVLFALNEGKLFIPGSVTKLVTAGTALGLLGPDFRFHTRVFRTGPLTREGVVEGDVVLVAGGDPNLSNRVRSDGTLAFENEDHSYGHVLEAKLVPGNPLQVIDALAAQVAAKGVRKIAGRVLVDATLFPEGTKEGGSGVVISPIVVNDNVIDVVVTPGKAVGEGATIMATPLTAYATFRSEVTTGERGSEAQVGFATSQGGAGHAARDCSRLGGSRIGAAPLSVRRSRAEPLRARRLLRVAAARRRPGIGGRGRRAGLEGARGELRA